MATGGRMVLNDLLCFAIKKYSRVDCQQLKTTIMDFISLAKELLSDEIETIQDTIKIPRPARRCKDTVNCVAIETDDFLLHITWLDESKLLCRLPIFVSSDPDKMPSLKRTESDMAMIMLKLGKLGDGFTSLKQTLNNNSGSVTCQFNELGRLHKVKKVRSLTLF